jgi:outer membrane protein assembly factor BamB
MAGGNPQRTGRAAEAVRVHGAKIRRLPATAAVLNSVVLDDQDRVLVADMGGAVRCFSPRQRLVWERRLEGGAAASPAVDPASGRVFVATVAGFVYALDTSSGTPIWRRALPTTADPRILADLLLAGNPGWVVTSSWGGKFHALASSTGETIASWDAGISPRSAASADTRGRVYCWRVVRNRGLELVTVDPAGEEKVMFAEAAGSRGVQRLLAAAAPVLDEARDRLYGIVNRDRDGQLCAWSLANGSLIWRCLFGRALAACPAIRPDGSLVVADMSGQVQLVTVEGQARILGATECEYLLAAPVCDARGCAYVGDPTGALHEVSGHGPMREVFVARRALQAQASVDRRGQLYVPDADGSVHFFECRG